MKYAKIMILHGLIILLKNIIYGFNDGIDILKFVSENCYFPYTFYSFLKKRFYM